MLRNFYNICPKGIGRLAVVVIPLLSACGGGSGGSVDTPVPPAPMALSSLAGNVNGYGTQDGPASVARFGMDMGPMAVTASGDVVMADVANNRVRILHAGSQQVSTLAGGGVPYQDLKNWWLLSETRTSYADGARAAARFANIGAVAVDAAGNTYVADTGNSLVRKIDMAGGVTTLAGQVGVCGNQDGVGTAATLCWPSSIAVDKAGNVYVAEVKPGTKGNAANPIRKITAAGVVSTLTPKASDYPSQDYCVGCGWYDTYNPVRLAVDSSGTVYAADSNDYVIRKFTADGQGSVLSGTVTGRKNGGFVDGAASAAKFGQLVSITVDRTDRLFVLDQFDTGFSAIRQVGSDGSVVSVLRAQSCDGNRHPGTNLPGTLCNARQMAVNADGSFLVVETGQLSNGGVLHTQLRSYTRQGESTVLVGAAPVFGLTDGQGAAARFFAPAALAVGKSGSLYVGDSRNWAIRTVAADGTVRTLSKLCDTGDLGSTCGLGAMGIDGADNLYVFNGGSIRKVTPAGNITLVADLRIESFVSAGVGLLGGIAADSIGNVYVAAFTFAGQAIFKVTPKGEVTLFAGSLSNKGHVDGQGSAALFSQLGNIATDAADNLYVVDMGNDSKQAAVMVGPTIRKVTPAGVVSTLAGNPNAARGLTDGAGAGARFTLGPLYEPTSSLAADAQGNVYVTDPVNSVIRKVTPDGQVSTPIGQAWQYGFAEGALPGIINRPVGIAVRGGMLYISMDHGVVRAKLP